MRQHLRAILVTTLVFSAGCSMDLAGTNAPVTVTFVTPAYPGPGATTLVANDGRRATSMEDLDVRKDLPSERDQPESPSVVVPPPPPPPPVVAVPTPSAGPPGGA